MRLHSSGTTGVTSPPQAGPSAGWSLVARIDRRSGKVSNMGVGLGIFLIVLGAILTFALNLTVSGLDLDVIGWILMLAGLANLIFFIYVTNRRRSSATAAQRPPFDGPDQPPL